MPTPAGTFPLMMICPHCRAYLVHPVVRSVPYLCALPEAAARAIGAAMGRDLSFRVRERKCMACDAVFRVAEVSQADLFAVAEAFAALLTREVPDDEELVHGGADPPGEAGASLA